MYLVLLLFVGAIVFDSLERLLTCPLETGFCDLGLIYSWLDFA
jgi:hypothetical protein